MCCIVAVMGLIGPRAAALVWWLVDQPRWEQAFSSFWWAFLGFIFLPWTTLSWALVAGNGVRGFDWIWLALGVFLDLAMYGGSGQSKRRQGRGTASVTY
jgi:hypothetical protein